MHVGDPRDFLKTLFLRVWVVDDSRGGVRNRGRDPAIVSPERVAMPTIPRRIATVFAVLRGRYGDVPQMARERDRSRRSLHREAERFVEAVEGTAAEARIDGLPRRLAGRRAEVQAPRG